MALPFADDQFDLIYSAEVLQCVADLPALLAELARVARPGGRVVVSTLNRTSLFRQAMRLVRKAVPRSGAPAHTPSVMRTADEIVGSAHASALVVGRVCWVHFPFPWLWSPRSNRHLAEPLASNMIVEFIKPARSGRS